MNLVGIHYNHSPTDRTKTRGPSPSMVNRFTLIDAKLRESGRRVFIHRPQSIRPAEREVAGHLVEGNEYVPTTAEIPRVNGNWTHRTRRLFEKEGIGYQNFVRWAEDRGIGIYVPHAFSELIGNKLETYKLVRGYHETLHPHCEPYNGSEKQIDFFVETGDLTFLKPRGGSRGNRIVTIKRDDKGLKITHYEKRGRRWHLAKSAAEATRYVRQVTTATKKYVIQHGIETMRHEGSTFDIRVTMLNDGHDWHWLHEARLSPSGSDVSNVSQGGKVTVTEDLLFDLMGGEAAQQLLHELRSESYGLAAYLDQLHPGDILEVAFDFAIDREGRLRLLEINTKPGLAGIGADVYIFDKGPQHEEGFRRWVYPHTTFLASFLLHKAEQLER